MITGFFPGAPYGDPVHSVFALAAVVAPVAASGLVDIALSYSGSESTIPVYDKLDIVRVTATFTDVLTGGALTDPAARTFRLRTPDGVVSTATTPLQLSTGVWYVDLTASQIGHYRYRWEATGGARDGQFVVQGTLVH